VHYDPLTEQAGPSEEEVTHAQSELCRHFAGAGCIARAADLIPILQGASPAAIAEALRRLARERVVEVGPLSDGTLGYYFPRS
jgi:hypothetical protein